MDFPLKGELCALATAFLWSVSVIFFRLSGLKVHPLALNFFKNVVTLVCLTLTILLLGEPLLLNRPASDYAWLLLSGLLGMSISDTLFFKSLNILGASASAIIDCMYSPFMISFAFLFLGERLSLLDFCGAILIVIAVLVTIKDLRMAEMPGRQLALGIGCGVGSMAVMALGIVIIKPVLNEAPLLWSTNVRLFGGIVGLLLMAPIVKHERGIFACFRNRSAWRSSILGSLLGGYIVLPLWLGGMKFTDVSIASILNQLSTVFIVVWAAIFLKESLSRKKVGAVCLAFVGAVLIFV